MPPAAFIALTRFCFRCAVLKNAAACLLSQCFVAQAFFIALSYLNECKELLSGGPDGLFRDVSEAGVPVARRMTEAVDGAEKIGIDDVIEIHGVFASGSC